MLHSGVQNGKWPTSGCSEYTTDAVRGVHDALERRTKLDVAQKWPTGCITPVASERGTKSQWANQWACCVHNRFYLRGPRCFTRHAKIRSGPQVGRGATQPTLSRGSPMLQSAEQNQRWDIRGPRGYMTTPIWGVPNASEQGTKSEVAQKWATMAT